MTSLIIKEGTGTIRHLGSTILNYWMYSILLKTRIKRGNRDFKFDQCVKECLESEKKLIASY